MSMTNALKGSAFVNWRSKGKKVYLTPLDLDREGMFEEFLKERERRELAALKSVFDPLDYHKIAAEWVRSAAAGAYAYTSENGQKLLRTTDGVREFVRLLMLPKHPKVNPETVSEFIEECWSEIDLIIKDFFTRKEAEARRKAESAQKQNKPSLPATDSSFDPLETTATTSDATTDLEAADELDDLADDSGLMKPMTPTGTFLGGSLSSNA